MIGEGIVIGAKSLLTFAEFTADVRAILQQENGEDNAGIACTDLV
jgi:hypothetical protein